MYNDWVMSFWGKQKKRILVFCGVLLIGGGLYLLLLVLAPNQPISQARMEELKNEPVGETNLIIIPKIGVEVAINEGDAGALRNGAWHRYPERGNPIDGGNFIVTAHRFIFSLTPGRVRDQSYFYNIDKLAVGDNIIIHWRGKQYNYTVSEAKQVAPNAVEIEAPSKKPILTIYACTLKGVNDGRVVVIAKPEN